LEQWREIEGFNNYAISNLGRIQNLRRESILTPSINRQGILKVGLFDIEGRLTSRSLAVLVAEAFLELDPRPSFDSIIQLDGDRTNCHVENLMRRPRWFAIKYHQQFYNERFRFGRRLFMEIETEEVFEDYVKPCTTYGLYHNHIMNSFYNRGEPTVFPTDMRFRLLE
jgi:hypothetical protein